jgi:hypothetical protein
MNIEVVKETIVEKASHHNWRKTIISTVAGIVLGLIGYQVSLIMQDAPPYYDNNPPKLVQYGHYVGVEVDHTRTSYCELRPQRFLFTQNDSFDVPVVYPIPTANYFIWPHIGRVHIIVLIPIPTDLPPGNWFIQSVADDDCHWYSGLLGTSLIISKPLALKGMSP